MKARIEFELTPELKQCAVAYIILSNKVADLEGVPKQKVNASTINKAIRDRLWEAGWLGLDTETWARSLGAENMARAELCIRCNRL